MRDASDDSGIATLARRIRAIMATYRRSKPLTPLPAKGGCYLVPSSSGGQPFTLPLVWYPSPACRWSEIGGCTMCNFGAGPEDQDQAGILAAIDEVLERIDPGVQGIFFAPGGSFLNDREIALDDRSAILQRLTRFPFLRMVGVETRPSYVTPARLEAFVAALPSSVRYALIGMGLESVSRIVRDVCINKGNDLTSILRAIAAIQSMPPISGVKLGFELYVLLKPPFLSEREAIDDAVRTVEWAASQGADTVGLFVTVVKENTLCDFLSRQSDWKPPLRYEPPWWYSAFEVLRQLTPETAARVQVLGPTSEIANTKGPRACDLCRDILSGTITAWNYYRDQRLLSQIENLKCECKEVWRSELEQEMLDLEHRIPKYIGALEALMTPNDGDVA